jgi:tetratricopeptide (TPR) repeat protein
MGVWVGQTVAERFMLLREAGSGGMGVVYQALDRLTGENVAVKLLGADDPQSTARFLREGRVLAELTHPGIVRYVAHGSSGGQRYLAMEWLEGEDLARRLARGRLSVADTFALAGQVAETLAHAHARGVVHRDLKPSNLFLVSGEVKNGVKLLDFGVARFQPAGADMTVTGTRLGTPGYMSPEQAHGQEQVDARSDIFGLGLVLYQCLAGRKAFIADDPLVLIAKIMLADPPSLSELCEVPQALEDLIERMLAKEPERRPADGRALANELSGLRQLELASTTGGDRRRLTGRERRLYAVVGVLSGAAVDPAWMASLARERGGTVQDLPDGERLIVLSSSSAAGTATTTAATDLATTAARCALRLLDQLGHWPISVAIGRGILAGQVPMGEVIDRTRTLLQAGQRSDRTVASPAGTLPASAASDPAGAARLRIDQVTAGLLGPGFEVSGDEEGLILVGERDLDEPLRLLLGRPTPCVAREAELGTLGAILAACTSEPTARAVLVTGPAGVGKSRVRYEFLRQLQDRHPAACVLLGRGDPIRSGAPFRLLAEAILRSAGVVDGEPEVVQRQKLHARLGRHLHGKAADRVAEFIGALTGIAPDQPSVALRAAENDAQLLGDQMRRAVEDWLAAECSAVPVVLVLEDLHWGDLPTVQVIDACLRRLADQPFMVLALGRPEVLELFPQLWHERELSHIRLGELSRRASERLVREVLGPETPGELVGRLVERAGGNAFYLEELIRAVHERGPGQAQSDNLPETVVTMVQARLEAMDPAAREVLRTASIFGQVFWERGVATLLGEERAAELGGWLRELQRREVVSRRGSSRFAGDAELTFRHALVREAAYGMLTEADRELGHRLAGEWLEEAGEHDPVTLAEHFRRGGALDRAARAFCRAAGQALRGGDLEQALGHCWAAAECGASGPLLGTVRGVEAEARRWRGEYEASATSALEALRWLPARSPEWFAAVEELVYSAGARVDRAQLLEVRTWLVTPDSSGLAAEAAGAALRATARLASTLQQTGLPEAAVSLFATLAEVSPDLLEQEPALAARLLAARAAHANFEGRAGDYLELSGRALQAFDRAGDLRSACMLRGLVGYALMEIGAYAESVATLREVELTARQMGLTHVLGTCRQNLGLALGCLGNLAEAIPIEESAVTLFEAAGNRRMEAASRYYLSFILHRAGQIERAESEARCAVWLATRPPGLLPIEAEGSAFLALVLLARGAIEPAREAAGRAHQVLQELGGIDGGESLIRLIHAETLKAGGDQEGARQAIQVARERLLVRADRIRDPALRRGFLEHAWENARTLELARELSADPAA